MLDADIINAAYETSGSVRGAARMLGVDERTLRRWAKDDKRIGQALGKPRVEYINTPIVEKDALIRSLRSENKRLRQQLNGEVPEDGMKIVFFDTESTDLAASWGRVLCTSYAINDGPVVTLKGTDYTNKHAVDDSGLVVATREVLESADILCGWNSILHDVPLLNARLAKVGERPIRSGEKYGTWHLDLMYYSTGASMKIGGKALDKVAKYFRCENQKTPLDGETWQLAGAGDAKALCSIVEHCEADVEVLREVAQHLFPYVHKFKFDLGEVYPFISQIPSRR